MTRPDGDWRAFSQNLVLRALLGSVRRLPYAWRVPAMGWVAARIVAPLAGWDKRIEDNLAHVCPDMGKDEVARLKRAVPDNAGRTLIEIYSGAEFKERLAQAPLTGPGVTAFEEARAAGRPVIFVTAHFGNFDAPRAALFAQGHPVAGLYRPMRNARFNEHYVKAISGIGEPVFAADRRGVLGLVKHLAKGGIIGILVDVYANDGADVTYFGKPAKTAVSAAEWALKYNALVIPIYGIRAKDGLNFSIVLDSPVAHGDPVSMTQALNNSLEAQVRGHMEQWFWIHRRWDVKY